MASSSEPQSIARIFLQGVAEPFDVSEEDARSIIAATEKSARDGRAFAQFDLLGVGHGAQVNIRLDSVVAVTFEPKDARSSRAMGASAPVTFR